MLVQQAEAVDATGGLAQLPGGFTVAAGACLHQQQRLHCRQAVLDAVMDLLKQQFLFRKGCFALSQQGGHFGFGRGPVAQGAAQFELRHDLAGQRLERGALRRGQAGGTRRAVQHAHRAERHARLGEQDGAAIEAQVRIAGDQRIGGEPRIRCQVGHDEDVGLLDGVGADRDVAPGLADAEPGLAREPLPRLVHQADERDRHLADMGSDLHEIVEHGVCRGVEDVVAPQRRQALGFRSRSAHAGASTASVMVPLARSFMERTVQARTTPPATMSRAGQLRMVSADCRRWPAWRHATGGLIRLADATRTECTRPSISRPQKSRKRRSSGYSGAMSSFLPDEALKHRRVIRQMVQNLRSGQPVVVELPSKGHDVSVTKSVGGAGSSLLSPRYVRADPIGPPLPGGEIKLPPCSCRES